MADACALINTPLAACGRGGSADSLASTESGASAASGDSAVTQTSARDDFFASGEFEARVRELGEHRILALRAQLAAQIAEIDAMLAEPVSRALEQEATQADARRQFDRAAGARELASLCREFEQRADAPLAAERDAAVAKLASVMRDLPRLAWSPALRLSIATLAEVACAAERELERRARPAPQQSEAAPPPGANWARAARLACFATRHGRALFSRLVQLAQ